MNNALHKKYNVIKFNGGSTSNSNTCLNDNQQAKNIVYPTAWSAFIVNSNIISIIKAIIQHDCSWWGIARHV